MFCFLQDAELTDGEDSVNGDDDVNDEISREFPIQEDDGDKYFEPVGGAKKRSSSPRSISSVLLPPQPIKSAMKKPGQPPRVRKQASMGKNRSRFAITLSCSCKNTCILFIRRYFHVTSNLRQVLHLLPDLRMYLCFLHCHLVTLCYIALLN